MDQAFGAACCVSGSPHAVWWMESLSLWFCGPGFPEDPVQTAVIITTTTTVVTTQEGFRCFLSPSLSFPLHVEVDTKVSSL